MTDLADRELLETAFRLLVATLAGMAIGLNRDLHDKPVGMRTLGLVSLSSALVVLSATGYGSLHYGEDAASRIIQGLLTGVGFLGAGVILHDASEENSWAHDREHRLDRRGSRHNIGRGRLAGDDHRGAR